MQRKPLKDLCILVTRPRTQAGPLAADLAKAGARVISTPLIKTVPPTSFAGLDNALKNITIYDCIVFTSANAVDYFFSRARRLRRPKRLFAIGRATAEALAKRGWKARTALDSRAEGLARLMGPVKGWNILIPRAKVAREVLPGLLRKRGAKVTVVEAYRTMADEAGIRRLKGLRLESIDAVTFTSGSTVDQFLRALGRARGRRLFARAAAASIGPVTSTALHKRGIVPAVEGKALCPALIRYFRRRS